MCLSAKVAPFRPEFSRGWGWKVMLRKRSGRWDSVLFGVNSGRLGLKSRIAMKEGQWYKAHDIRDPMQINVCQGRRGYTAFTYASGFHVWLRYPPTIEFADLNVYRVRVCWRGGHTIGRDHGAPTVVADEIKVMGIAPKVKYGDERRYCAQLRPNHGRF